MNGVVRIKTVVKNGRTILVDSYCTQPFKLGEITEDKKDHSLHVMLMSSSPGILDNDEYTMEIDLGENSHMRLFTQSYQRIFQMRTGAKQYMEVYMGKGSSFTFLPHPSVPHQCSIFSSINRFHLDEGCRLIYGEVLSCGRKHSGELFKFSRYHALTEILSNGKLCVKENLLSAPGIINVNKIGQLEGYTHQSSLTFVAALPLPNTLIDDIHDLLLNEREVCVGISALTLNGFNIKMLGHGAEQLYNLHNLVSNKIVSSQCNTSVKTTAYAK